MKNPDNRPKDFTNLSYYTGGWADINVPVTGNARGMARLSMSTKRMSLMIKMFNFKKNPPLVPYAENEVGPTDVPSKCLPTGKDAG